MSNNNVYLNILNDDLVHSPSNKKKEKKQRLDVWEKIKKYHDLYLIKNWKDCIIEFTDRKTNQIYLIYMDLLRNSGLESNNNKRLHVRPNSFNNNILPIGIYDGGNILFFVYFSDHNILKNKSKNNKSVWVDFKYIFYAIKNKIDVKYKSIAYKNKYYIYITSNLCKIFNKDFNDFKMLDKDSINNIEKLIENFVKEKEIKNNINNDFIYDNCFVINNKNKLSNYETKENNFAWEAEKLFYELIQVNPELICEKIKIKKITKCHWLNEKRESYLPYDFIINKNIFIDVKSTLNKKPNFSLSNKEYEFMSECRDNNKTYCIANITSIDKQENHKWYFFDFDEIQELNKKERTEYKFWED